MSPEPESVAHDPAATAGREHLALSVIVPAYNEEDSIPLLAARLFDVLDRMARPFEIICINDGSRDGTAERLRAEAARRPEFKVINLRRNCGQTAALMAGIDHASGDVIVMIDADLQNDPEDIPALVARLEAGYDVVSGWRRERKDAPIRRTFVSRIANRVISLISGVHLNDYGCTLKAYRADVIKGVRLYGEMHRFIPIYASWQGARVTELAVRHHARQYGHSKYGLERVVKVILDLIVVVFLDRYFTKPIYVFGTFGLGSLLLALLSGALMVYLRVVAGISMILTPLPLLTAIFFLIGVVSCFIGLIAEMLVRTYFESQGRAAYLVGESLNFGVRKP